MRSDPEFARLPVRKQSRQLEPNEVSFANSSSSMYARFGIWERGRFSAWFEDGTLLVSLHPSKDDLSTRISR